MGDDYLLPSIAVVVVGGALITGGRGHYLGMLGGVLLLTALQTLLAGTTLPYATRAIIYGLVVLGAVIALARSSRYRLTGRLERMPAIACYPTLLAGIAGQRVIITAGAGGIGLAIAETAGRATAPGCSSATSPTMRSPPSVATFPTPGAIKADVADEARRRPPVRRRPRTCSAASTR